MNPPAWLDESAAVFWQEHARRCIDSGTLNDSTAAAFASLCSWWAKWRAAEEQVTALGQVIQNMAGGASRSPFAIAAEKAWQQTERLMKQFGLLPQEKPSRPSARDENPPLSLVC